MTDLEADSITNWWAEGDTPVRLDSRVTYLVDGRSVMLTMCLHFLKAQTYIYLADWGLTPTMAIVRGKDQRAGPDGSPEQEAFLAKLRASGLQEEDIHFWCSHTLSLQALLGHAVSKGVDVKVLLWDCLPLPGLSYYKPKEAHEQLTQVGVTCILDDSARGIIHHPVESLHQKIGIVDGARAFVGGVDPMIELGGHFDHWDTSAHLFSSPLRCNSEDPNPYPWHDVHAHIEGPAAGDVEHNFCQRWNDVVQRHSWQSNLLLSEHPPVPALESKSLVQIARTIPEHTYSFEPLIVRGIAQLYANALSNVQHFVYLENQYFWLRSYMGIELPFLGADNPEMARNIRELGAALRRGAMVVIVLPDHPDPGRAYADAALRSLREEAPAAVKEGRILAFCLGTSTSKEDREYFRPIYVHAKVAIVDDLWVTVGSANLNNRGMRDDTEMNVATLDGELAHSLRLMLWSEHLGLLNDDDLLILLPHLAHQQQDPQEDARARYVWNYLQETIGDPMVGLRMMADRAQENLRRYKAKQPLLGHLLPYLTAEEAAQEGLNFHEERGWVEET
ncbi:MAG: phospholipase D-like domain-containing protein [Ktedonobacteraceae bacterium]